MAALAGLAGGLLLFVRGLGGYRAGIRIGDTATSAVSGIALGEVRLTGAVQAAELLLVSPLQSVSCVYYRATVRQHDSRSDQTVYREERAVGFRLLDQTGEVRVFPRDARWAVPDRFNASTDRFSGPAAGLNLREGPALRSGRLDRKEQIADLLTVHRQDRDPLLGNLGTSGEGSYQEARIEPGDTVTILGFAMPFGQLADPTGANDAAFGGPASAADDPTITADLAAARAAGALASDPAEAWGNAAIPGFGMGHPVRTPTLDPEARPMPIADAATAARIERIFEIAPETLVVGTARDTPLLVSLGGPAEAEAREDRRFVVGLLGAVVAIGSAVVLAVTLNSWIPT